MTTRDAARRTHDPNDRPVDILVDADSACRIAGGFLLDEVGDLLMVDRAQLGEDGCWHMAIVLSNAVDGVLGDVGAIAVDSTSGEVHFSEEARAKVEASAQRLARASSS